MNDKTRDMRLKLIAGASVAALMAVPSFAQVLPTSPAPTSVGNAAETGADADIVVTGSRIQRSGYTAPTPLTVISTDDLANRSLVSVADYLNELPAFANSQTPSTSTLNSQQTGGNYLNLRGLGTNRTLVLVNGRRHVATDLSGASVDLNVIPSGLIDRVEVVTGGASAAWGSDAVAGVVNLILKRNIRGFQGDVQFGQSDRGDNREIRTSLAWGTPFDEGRGQVTIAGELVSSKGVLHQTDRDWTREWGIITNPAYAAGNGQFRQLIVPDARLSIVSRGGVIVAGPLRGTQFLAGGTPAPFQYGTSVGTYMSGGDGVNLSALSPIKTPVERKSVYFTTRYDLTSNVEAFVEASYANARAENDLMPTFSQANAVIRQDNAFLPSSIRAQMVARNLQTIVLGRADYDLPPLRPENELNVYRVVAGFSGTVAKWKWNASYVYGRSDYDSVLRNNRVNANYALALDAVVNPLNGQVVCRSALTNPASRCVPFNPFGEGSPSREAIAYTTADQFLSSRTTQNAFEASAQGDVIDLPAGAVTLAVGAHYREDDLRQNVDALSASNAFLIGNPKASAGKITVKEFFGETLIPILADKWFAKRIELNGAVRRTSYSASGSVTTWKVGLSYDVNDDLRFRGTRSRDIRAPNLAELFTPGRLDFSSVIDRQTNSQTPVRVIIRGNSSLIPEKADTLTFGVVYQPRWAPGFRASVDYYKIDINGVISTIANQRIVDRCFAGVQSVCDLITRGADGKIFEISSAPLNLNRQTTKGIDIEASYTSRLDPISLPGAVSLRLLANYVDELSTNDGVGTIDRAGDVGSNHNGVPHWQLFGTATYTNGPAVVALTGQFIGAGKYDNTYGLFDINDNNISSRLYLNLNARYKLIDRGEHSLEMFGGISNLLDKDPPVNIYNGSISTSTNYALYELIGRSYTVGLRFKY